MKAKCMFVVVCVACLGMLACSGTSSPDSDTGPDAVADAEGTTDVQPGGDVDIVCIAECTDLECGDDGCGGSCGSCAPGQECDAGKCPICVPNCAGKECGPDECGGYCGNGDAATEGCKSTQLCEAELCSDVDLPDCDGKECGPDGMDGSCGTCPCDDCVPEESQCSADGLCEAIDDPGCPGIFECLQTCQQGDQACGENCINASSIEDQIAYDNLTTCLDEAGYFGCAQNDDDCRLEALTLCIDQYYECFHGDLSCLEMYLCLIGCPTGQAGDVCSAECFVNGTIDALKTWDIFTACLIENGYSECTDDACAEAALESCDEEYTACANGHLSCSDVLDCTNECAPMDQMCNLTCEVSGTVDAQANWDALDDCIVEQCGETIDAECKNSALEGACSGVYNACIGS